jgi:hypothetical protein
MLIGEEGYLTDPRFDQGVSVKLTPSVSVVDRVFEKEYTQVLTTKLSIPTVGSSSLNPVKIK